ncbi:MAG: protein kinase [Anaerolineae bacterium]|nr:protein kinase [Anaerolineae bacterium]
MLAGDVGQLAGQKLGQYELRERIGAGGMAAVYRAHQLSLRRDVAVKVLSAALSQDTDFYQRFVREAQTSAQLEHPHIIPVYDYGTQDGLSFVAMRLLTGGTLAQRLQNAQDKSTSLPGLGEVVSITRSLASALDYAHSRQILHRDVKPSNVMFDEHGSPFLVDFGIARMLSGANEITGSGIAMGTPSYMSPEQWRGDTVTPASDQYALGIVVYEMLTGRQPYAAETPWAILHKHLNDPLPSLGSGISDMLYAVLAKAAAKSPTDRFPTCRAFADALEKAVGESRSESTGFSIGGLDKPLPAPAAPPAAVEAEAPPPQFEFELQRKRESARDEAVSTGVYPAPTAPAPQTAARKSGLPLLVIASGLLAAVGLIAVVLSLISANGPLQTQPPGLSPLTLLGLVLVVIGAAPWVIPALQDRFRQNRPSASPPRPQQAAANVPTEPPATEPEPAPALDDILTIKPPPAPAPAPIAPPKPVYRAMASLEEGERLGIYELRKRLDKGERNRVYHAFDTHREREVAVKVLGLGESSEERGKRFAQEARILGALHHPHIVPFLDYDSIDGLSFIVMPLLEGGTLKEKLAAGRMNGGQVMGLLKEVGSALDYLHSQKVIHRDLKASNIMFDQPGNAYLVDFGIAKLTDSAAQQNITMVGQVVGTPSYMAPEQWLGVELTPAVDQYALAILCFQMLTGQLPFDAPNTPGLLYKHMYDPPPFPSKMQPDLPTTLDDVLHKALAKKAEERYPSTRQFVEALGQALAQNGSPERKLGHVFISYSRRDQDYARQLADQLRTNGFGVWIDDRIDYGDRWFKEIEQAIVDCAAITVIMTPDSHESEWVHREILIAKREKKPIFPLLLKGQEFGILIDIQYADVRSGHMPPDGFYIRLRRDLAARGG